MSISGLSSPINIPSQLSIQWPDGTTRTLDASQGVFGATQSFANLMPPLESEADLSARLKKEAEPGMAASREKKIEGVIYRDGQALVTFYEGSIGMTNALASKLGGDRISALGLAEDRRSTREKIAITLRELGIDERDVSTYDLSDISNGPRVRDNAAAATEDGLKAFLKESTNRSRTSPSNTGPLLTGRLSAATLFETMQRTQTEDRIRDHP